jgi:hypothetical protein
MAAKILNFEMRRGDTPVLEAELRDENRNLIDDAAAQYKLTARATRSAADPPVFEVGPLPQYAPGIGRCGIPISATSGFTHDRFLFYDLQVVEGNANVNTLLTGTITVLMDVAR